MNWTNIFIEVISLTNVAIFVNRLIVDGNYKTALLLYDYTSVRDTRFIQELTSPSKGNHNSIILRSADSLEWTDLNAQYTFLQAHGELPIVMMNFDLQWNQRMLNLMTPLDRSVYNYVFLLPMPHDFNKKRIVTKIRQEHPSFQNTSIVFYQTPLGVPTNKSLEVFVNSICHGYNCSIFDIDRQTDILTRLNQIGNLHEFVFEKSMKKTFIYWNDRNVSSTAVNVMLNDSNWYLANYINLNMKGSIILQVYGRGYYYEPKNSLIYAEMFLSSLDRRSLNT